MLLASQKAMDSVGLILSPRYTYVNIYIYIDEKYPTLNMALLSMNVTVAHTEGQFI